ncbi:MAG: type VII secretion protein EccB [Actinocatenispora sp.]
MASRRDQLHSYQFIMRRVTSALVVHEPDSEQLPFRRLGGGVFVGLMVAILVAAGFGVYGVFKPGGNTGWQEDHAVIVEKETGAVYVYQGKVLHPMINYASALLLAGQQNVEAKEVSRNSLAGATRGTPWGIPGAPTSLPDADHVLGIPWTLCSEPRTTTPGQPTTRSILTVGRAPRSSHRLGNQGALVKDADTGAVYLIWHSHRYLITDPDSTLGAMVWDEEPVATSSAWLDALPAGQDIATPRIDDVGSESTALANAKVGEVFVVQRNSRQIYYVALADKLAAITQFQALLLLGAPELSSVNTGGHGDGAPLGPAQALEAPRTDTLLPPEDSPSALPADPPAIAPSSNTGASCAVYRDSSPAPEVLLQATLPDDGRALPTKAHTEEGLSLADRVLVPSGRIAVIEGVGGRDAPAGGLNLVTDTGVRYPVPDRTVLASLGYGETTPNRLPASLVARIPEGPTLDPSRAHNPAPQESR